MTTLPDNVFHDDDLLYFASADDPSLWYVVPGGPVPDTSRGAPALQTCGNHTNLALAVRWLTLDAGALATLAAAIRQRHALPATVRVEPVPPSLLLLDGMDLCLADADGRPRLLAASKTSGYAPWDAVFSVMLDGAAAASAHDALVGGRAGLLTLTVRYALNLPVRVNVRVSGTVPPPDAALLARLAESDDADAADAVVQGALRSGDLIEEVTPPLVPDAGLIRDIAQQAHDQARMLVAQNLEQQVDAWRAIQARAAEGAAAGTGWLAKTFGTRRPAAPPPPFAGQPLALDVASGETRNVRIPAQQTDAGQSWLSATTDLGAWASRRRDLR